MRHFAFIIIAVIPLLAQTPPKSEPVSALPSRETMLRNMVQAGILMLEGSAYRQFVQTFLREEERSRFRRISAGAAR
ncbi:MAG: hypothetical protein U1F27_13600 [Turneriella sp.]